ncbi:hypothetical protein [Bacteroides sp. 51]|uniref:hypothetical protein n=1 Tax=Bacteroides sp. 51 TaxID=2302938 RepID=UPI0013D621DA|nr:hypothetical protein [Bacteroides sp. 51]NDV82956.1 hypothetical protein [Bacteroides sp. 51]
MAKTNRKTLKEYFGKGKKPSSEQFADLVDSMLNIVDDGFGKSPEKGLLLSPLNEEGAVMEIRRNILGEDASWIFGLGKEEELHIYRESRDVPYLTLYKDGRVVLGNTDNPVSVKVNGTVQAHSFIGGYMHGKIPADGFWHPIGEMEYGCRSYHIAAACGLKNTGKYAIANVTAMHCFGQRRRIRGSNSWFGNRFNRIQFRWHVEGLNCGLQIRTRSNYGNDVWIHYRINTLFDIDFVTR